MDSKNSRELLGEEVNAHKNDVINMWKTTEGHGVRSREDFEAIYKNEHRINKGKIQFSPEIVKLLCIKISEKDRSTNEIKRNEALTNLKLNNIRQSMRFVGSPCEAGNLCPILQV